MGASMSFRLPIDNCLDEEGDPHMVTLHDDGTMTFDGNHDPDLELALGELGAKLPACLLVYQAWLSDPCRIVGNASHALAYQYGKTVSYFISGITLSLAIDFVRHVQPTHVAPSKPLKSGYRHLMSYSRPIANLLLAIATGKEILDIRHRDAAQRLAALKINLESRSTRPPPLASLTYSPASIWHVLAKEADTFIRPMVLAKMTPRDRIRQLDDLAFICTQLAGDPPFAPSWLEIHPDPKDQAAEADWQRRQIVRGITALKEGRAWPAVEVSR
jgi:hypothetical protein